MVQPMIAKMILPSFGGAPAVWNTSLVFFQAVLLAGYAYAHLSTRLLGPRKQALLHLFILGAAALFLVQMPESYDPSESGLPVQAALLLLLLVVVGAPFFACSAGAPLVQRWFAATRHQHAADPYFLYAASNFGSFVALLAYPLVVEPALALDEQRTLWRYGFFALVALMGFAAILMWRAGNVAELSAPREQSTQQITATQRLGWVALAAVPTSLLLGVTSFLTANIAAVPLLWVIPLALFLLTYVVAFRSKPLFKSASLGRATGLAAVAMALLVSLGVSDPILVTSFAHIAFFTLAALFCHSRLAESRPDAGNLTEFYLYLSLGGVIGGAFNALLAPALFANVAEYPIAIIAALLFRASLSSRQGSIGRDAAYAIGVACVAVVAYLVSERVGIAPGPTRNIVMLGVPILAAFLSFEKPARYALSIGAILIVSLTLNTSIAGRVTSVQRSFFGVHRIVDEPTETRALLHGNTIHGRQSLILEKRHIPLTYYHPTGPMGNLFQSFQAGGKLSDVGLVGLGVGALAAYGRPGDRFTFFEIDPIVIEIARDSGKFTFLRDSRADVRMVVGDARLTLAKEPDASYDLLVLDAFSSDAIPTHLLTVEAIRMYLSKLREGGVLAFHISNRYLDLRDPLARAANALSLQARVFQDSNVSDTLREEGKTQSTWVVMGATPEALAPLGRIVAWMQLMENRPGRLWTDDYSNVVGALARGE